MKLSLKPLLLGLMLCLTIGLLVATTLIAGLSGPNPQASGAAAHWLASQPGLALDHLAARAASAAKPLTHPWLGSLVPTQRGAVSWNGSAG